MSVAEKAVMGTIREVEVAEIENDAITGFVTSGKVIVTCALNAFDIFPAASFAQANNVLVPSLEKVNDVGAEALQPGFDDGGVVAVSVSRYPVTFLLSEAVKLETDITNDVEVDGIVNAVTTGFTISGKVIVTCALKPEDTFPAASFAHAYNVLVPSEVNVYDVGAKLLQPEFDASGADEVSVIKYPVTPLLSVAVNPEILTINDEEEAGMENKVTSGFEISGRVIVT